MAVIFNGKRIAMKVEPPPVVVKTVELAMADGDQVVTPPKGMFLSKVTIEKPYTLIPENIKKDVNIGGVIGTNDGGGGEQPQMNAPSISLSQRVLTLNNPSTNGNFFSKFKVFANGILRTETAGNKVDLATILKGSASYTVYAKCAGDLFADSEPSNSVTYKPQTIAYYGAIAPLMEERRDLAATTVGGIALFAGGYGNSRITASVNAYNGLLQSVADDLSEARYRLAATTVGNYALFGGGRGYDGITATVDAYNASLTRTIPPALSEAKESLAATKVGKYALFGGGTNFGAKATVDAYNASLTRTIPPALSEARCRLAATTVGNYALFGGGASGSTGKRTATVDIYNENLTQLLHMEFPVATDNPVATTVGGIALFAGGYGNGITSSIYGYNENLSRVFEADLCEPKNWLAATTVGGYALFGGGANVDATATVDAYTASFTRTLPTGLSQARRLLSATTGGGYALFAGGASLINGESTALGTVDVYYLA